MLTLQSLLCISIAMVGPIC